MTISALSRVIQEDLGESIENSPALTGCLEELGKSKSDLVGIAIGDGQMAEAFIAGQLGIRELEQRSAAFREYPDARYYLCREGRAKQCDRHVFFQELWLRVIEQGKKQGSVIR